MRPLYQPGRDLLEKARKVPDPAPEKVIWYGLEAASDSWPPNTQLGDERDRGNLRGGSEPVRNEGQCPHCGQMPQFCFCIARNIATFNQTFHFDPQQIAHIHPSLYYCEPSARFNAPASPHANNPHHTLQGTLGSGQPRGHTPRAEQPVFLSCPAELHGPIDGHVCPHTQEHSQPSTVSQSMASSSVPAAHDPGLHPAATVGPVPQPQASASSQTPRQTPSRRSARRRSRQADASNR